MTLEGIKKTGGPKLFDLSSEKIREESRIEEKLRNSLFSLENTLKKVRFDFSKEKSYLALIDILEAKMPEIYDNYDNYINFQLNRLPSAVVCKRGCGGCCVHYVASVEPIELIFLDWQIKKRPDYSTILVNLFNKFQNFQNLADQEEDYDEDVVLYKYFLRGHCCPFQNKEGSCSIYKRRPIPCRMFFSISKPELCVGTNVISPENKNFIVELPDDIEIIISQIGLLFESLELTPMFYAGLLRMNELFGKFTE
ncbi:MAG: YkgJ family cysteine cluster protein [Fibrobacteria bacterium]|nr:YkgJ family cysteine cluster protein [Fibrobacteria bacterium]